ncbi:hypothetical protein IP81_18800 [Novosphingobium sp. AAP83]|nr:hypothetical protein IP81_18800 [Novosphingobium sp. AAP83]
MIYRIFLPGALLLLVAFGPADDMAQRPAPQKQGTRQPDTCGSHTVTRFVGSDATPSVRHAITVASGQEQIRWIKPGTAVTQDFRADRLNVILDQAGRILTMRCG